MHITEKNVTQSGGMKILVKNERGEDVVVRKIVDMRQFISIFSNTIHIDILSVDSLTGFILRITLHEDATPFRSDLFSESGELMTAEEHKQPTTGRHVTQHILKCCIINLCLPKLIRTSALSRHVSENL